MLFISVLPLRSVMVRGYTRPIENERLGEGYLTILVVFPREL